MSRSRPLMPIVPVTVAIALVIAGAGMSFYIDRFNTQQKIDEVAVQARILASTVTAALQFVDHSATQEYIRALRTNPEIQVVAVYDVAGKLFASDAAVTGHGVPTTVAAGPPHFGEDRLIVTAP